jgi:microcin C transport system substrate-binding protein
MARNGLFGIVAAAGFALAAFGASAQDNGGWLYGISQFGELKYPEGFAHFDYVNPDAPKGGIVRLGARGDFDTLNGYTPDGTAAAGLGLIYDTLMTGAADEALSQYGLLAESMRIADDLSSVTFRLRANAHWNDGVPLTVDDVIWTFDTLKAENPFIADYYSHIISAEQTGDREVTFTFDEADNRELPIIMGQLVVLPKHYWTGTDANGNPRVFNAPTLDPPLGSGAYRISAVDPGRSITYERVPDYWGADLNVNVGQNNIDTIRYEYFLDETVMFEAFKADQLDFWDEYISRRWVNEYNFPAVTDGRVVMERYQPEVIDGNMLGYVFNLRRAPFDDIRVRKAFTLVYPFETVNQDLFYGQYFRPDSYFEGINLEADGLPQGRELEILESLRDQVPPEVFTADYTNPVNDTPEHLRDNLREALDLLTQAGFELRGNTLVNVATGEPLVVEWLNSQPTLEPQALRYQEELRKIGIDFQIRTVDSAQYVNRVRSRDYDIIYQGWGQTLSPGNEQLAYFGTQSANVDGTRNYAGIANPAIDAIIDLIINAPDRDELVAATHALDRVLSWNYYLSPGWDFTALRTARWDRYSRPETMPAYSYGFPTIWWWDDAKAAAVGPIPQ